MICTIVAGILAVCVPATGAELTGTTPTTHVSWRTSNHGTASERPKLVVEHSAPASGDPGTIQNLNYTYDDVGNITQLADYSTSTAKVISYGYDTLYRLTSASTTAASSTPYSQTYAYSAIGNITNKSDVGAYTYSSTGYQNPHAPVTVNGVTYSYDNNGNLTGFGNTSYTWDYRDRLIQVATGTATSTYAYDHQNQRVWQKVLGSATTTYPNKYYSVTSATSTAYIFAGDVLVAYVEGNGVATSTYYVHGDHLGSTHAITNASGTVVQVLDYYPFGSQRISSGSNVSDRQFIGERYDASTDLNYLNARYLQSTRGQFLSQDPVFWEIGSKLRGQAQDVFLRNPQSLNSYSYAENNPIIKKDPEGRCAGPLIFVCLGVIGANLGIWTNYAGGVLEKQAQGSTNPYEFDMSYRELGTSAGFGAFELAALPESRAISGAYSFSASLAEDRAAGNQANYPKAFVTAGTSVIAGTFFKNLVGNVPASLVSRSQVTNQVFQNASGLVANNALGTNNSIPFQTAQNAAKAAGIGNTGGGTFVGTYNFGTGVGTFNFGTGSWVGTAQSTPATIR